MLIIVFNIHNISIKGLKSLKTHMEIKYEVSYLNVQRRKDEVERDLCNPNELPRTRFNVQIISEYRKNSKLKLCDDYFIKKRIILSKLNFPYLAFDVKR